MKFGALIKLLAKNILFTKYIQDAIFLPYLELKKFIKKISLEKEESKRN